MIAGIIAGISGGISNSDARFRTGSNTKIARLRANTDLLLGRADYDLRLDVDIPSRYELGCVACRDPYLDDIDTVGTSSLTRMADIGIKLKGSSYDYAEVLLRLSNDLEKQSALLDLGDLYPAPAPQEMDTRTMITNSTRLFSTSAFSVPEILLRNEKAGNEHLDEGRIETLYEDARIRITNDFGLLTFRNNQNGTEVRFREDPSGGLYKPTDMGEIILEPTRQLLQTSALLHESNSILLHHPEEYRFYFLEKTDLKILRILDGAEGKEVTDYLQDNLDYFESYNIVPLNDYLDSLEHKEIVSRETGIEVKKGCSLYAPQPLEVFFLYGRR